MTVRGACKCAEERPQVASQVAAGQPVERPCEVRQHPDEGAVILRPHPLFEQGVVHPIVGKVEHRVQSVVAAHGERAAVQAGAIHHPAHRVAVQKRLHQVRARGRALRVHVGVIHRQGDFAIVDDLDVGLGENDAVAQVAVAVAVGRRQRRHGAETHRHADRARPLHVRHIERHRAAPVGRDRVNAERPAVPAGVDIDRRRWWRWRSVRHNDRVARRLGIEPWWCWCGGRRRRRGRTIHVPATHVWPAHGLGVVRSPFRRVIERGEGVVRAGHV